MSETRLAFTGGVTTLTIAGVAIPQSWIAALAILLIAFGVLVLRVGWRRGRTVGQR